MKLQCLVLEDQAPARHLIEDYIDRREDLELAGSTAFTSIAQAMLANENIDLMFLDLHLPQADGFEFLQSLATPPAIIVTTAFPNRALEGFEQGVSDYLVKPFSFERFSKAVDRVMIANSQPRSSARIEVQIGRGRHLYLNSDEIIRLSADGDYVMVITTTRTLHVTGPLSTLADKLPSQKFARIHRSHVVNVDRIAERSADEVLIGEERIRIGFIYKKALGW